MKNLEAIWKFGTAGFRAEMGDGAHQLNKTSVVKIAWAISQFLKPESRVVIGYDARHHSREFTELVAEVLNAQGHQSFIHAEIIPTPIGAFSVTNLKADLGIMITASHNPPADNGIKVYGSNGAQIVAPDTHKIEELIIDAPDFEEIKLSESEIKLVPESVIDAYFQGLKDVMPAEAGIQHRAPGELDPSLRWDDKITYTPLHGVGTKYALRALKEAGFKNIQVVASQAKPDGNFPTVKFPNPEEPGALDEALKLAKETSSELILANDPDADRLAVCVNQQILSGNEIGLLLANYLLENFLPLKKGGQGGFKPLVMTTFVSSRMLSYIAVKYQVSYEETATGFANIMSRAFERERDLGEKFLFGYEEALGYCIGHQVRDKDGISALVCFANLYAKLKYENKTVFDELDRLALEYGLFTSLSWSLKGDLNNLLSKAENLPDLDKQGAKVPGMTLYTGENDLRLIVRKSGTEPKIKFYAETIAHPKNLGELQKIRQEQMAYLENLHTKIEAYVQG